MANRANVDGVNPPPKRLCMDGTNDVFTTTEVDIDKFTFTWKINDFQSISESRKRLESEIFRGDPKTMQSWQASFESRIPFHYRDFTKECSALSIRTCAPAPTHEQKKSQTWTEFFNGPTRQIPIEAKMEVSIFDENNNLIEKSPSQPRARAMFWRCLIDQEKRSSIVNIYIVIKFEILISTKNTVVSHPIRREPKFSPNWEMMWKQSLLTDVDILSKHGTVFRAHKAFLGVHCPVLLAIFTSKDLKSVTINFDDAPIKAMLDYLYTGGLNCEVEVVLDLIQLSDMYDVPGLKAKCEALVELTVENAVDTLTFAEKYNAEYLKTRVTEFFRKNKDAIKDTESYQRMMKTAIHLT